MRAPRSWSVSGPRPLRRGRGWWYGGLLLLASCSALTSTPTHQQPYLRSFLGVAFGTSMANAQVKYPEATVETSPLGFNCLRLENQFGQGIRYQSVVFEFSDSAGMQLVLAEIAPGSDSLVLDRLKRLLGPPLRGSVTDLQSQSNVWLTPEGGQVTFNPARNLLVVRNSASSAFAEDVRLRLDHGSLVLK